MFRLIIPPAIPKYFVAINRPYAVIDFAPPELREKRDRNIWLSHRDLVDRFDWA